MNTNSHTKTDRKKHSKQIQKNIKNIYPSINKNTRFLHAQNHPSYFKTTKIKKINSDNKKNKNNLIAFIKNAP